VARYLGHPVFFFWLSSSFVGLFRYRSTFSRKFLHPLRPLFLPGRQFNPALTTFFSPPPVSDDLFFFYFLFSSGTGMFTKEEVF